MQIFKKRIEYTVFTDLNELSSDKKELMNKAIGIATSAYAPYSKFQVGASVLLSNGQIISGTNVENASYPVGVCAERNALAHVTSNYPSEKIISIAVYVPIQGEMPVPPCGMCRQFILELELKQKSAIEILLANSNGKCVLINSASDLLPLAFTGEFLK